MEKSTSQNVRKKQEGFSSKIWYPFLVLRAQPHYAVAYTSAKNKNKNKLTTKLNKINRMPYKIKQVRITENIHEFDIERETNEYLGEIDVEEERLFGVGDLNAILLVRIRDVDVVHSLCDCFHCCCVTVRKQEHQHAAEETLINQMLPQIQISFSYVLFWCDVVSWKGLERSSHMAHGFSWA